MDGPKLSCISRFFLSHKTATLLKHWLLRKYAHITHPFVKIRTWSYNILQVAKLHDGVPFKVHVHVGKIKK